MAEVVLFIVSLIAFLSAIWIVVPAPASFIWLFAVAASEWSLWIAIGALSSVVPNVYFVAVGNGGKLAVAALILGSIAIAFSLYPFASSLSVAREYEVQLSFGRYFTGTNRLVTAPEFRKPTTQTFVSTDDRELKLDVYLPTQSTENNGASVIVVHGGSWARGERSDFPRWNHLLAANGFTVFDIDYRLEQPNYLTATADVKCAIGWVQQNAKEFKISPDRIAMLGRSAGGQLALLAAYSAGDEHFPSECEYKAGSKVRAVVSIYSPVELIWAYDNPANQLVIDGPLTLANFLGGGAHASSGIRDRYILASPTSHVTTATPPTLIIHGGHDQLVRDENMRFLDQKLTESSVPHQTIFIPYAQHGFDYNINGWGAQIMEPAMLKFLSEHTR